MNSQHLGQVCAHARAALRSLETARHMAGERPGFLLGGGFDHACAGAQALLNCAEYERTQALQRELEAAEAERARAAANAPHLGGLGEKPLL